MKKKAVRPMSALTRKANAAMRDAVGKVVEDHRQRHMPLAIWQDGKVIPAFNPIKSPWYKKPRALTGTC